METEDENISLTIRCGLQSFDDFTLVCPIGWSVGELKQKISEVCPSKPEPSRQRLIFAGHCLNDSRLLRSIFEYQHVDSGVYVIHLVCPPKNLAELDELRRRKVKKAEKPTNAASANIQRSARSTNRSSAEHHQFTNANPTVPPLNLGANQTNPYFNPEFLTLYQSYMVAYNNFIQQTILNGGSITTLQAHNIANPSLGSWQVPTSLQPTTTPVEEPNPPPPPPAAAAAAAVQNDAPAAGGMVQEALFIDADAQQMEQRDFLDVIYKAIRIGFLVMLVYLYSSAERFLGVLLFILAVWFVQARRDRYNRQRGNNHLLIPAPAGNQQEGAENRSTTSEEAAGQADNSVYREPTPWSIFWSTCYSFITSFFTSLLPDNPIQVVN